MNEPGSRQRTDLPTVVIHWALVVVLLVSVSTGWRIASLADSGPLLRWTEALLFQGNVLRWHFMSALVLVSLVVAYIGLLWRMGLLGRLSIRWASFRSRDRNARWKALNRLVYWIAFALLGGAAISGGMLYFAPGLLRTEPLVALHQGLSWAFVGYIGIHVAAQLVLGGLRQLLNIVTPRLAYGVGAAFALAAGMAAAAVTYVADSRLAPLLIPRAATLPQLDGDGSDEAWNAAPETVVQTIRGFGLDGGEVAVRVKALHDGRYAYLRFSWPDATRSQKHVPLMKTESGWKLLHHNYFNNDENEFYEDKFAVMLAQSPVAGGNTVRLGPKPIADKPGPTHGLGLHAATDNSLADVWHWKSVRSGPLNQFDDNHFGAPMVAKPGRYTGGYGQDPASSGGYEQNFSRIDNTDAVRPKYLPRDLKAQQRQMGRFDPDPKVSETGDFAMPRGQVLPYSAALDARIPVGTVIPSVVFDQPFAGDRGDVSAHASWRDGWWTIEARRLLDTGSAFDQPIATGMFMWVAVFDHNQVRHTRHIRPLRIELQ